MKHADYIIAGGLLFAVLGFVLGSLATNWYGDHLARSDDDINDSVRVFFVAWPFIMVLGGYLGHRLHVMMSR